MLGGREEYDHGVAVPITFGNGYNTGAVRYYGPEKDIRQEVEEIQKKWLEAKQGQAEGDEKEGEYTGEISAYFESATSRTIAIEKKPLE
ncbi:MAG: hypothetical protein M1839_002987 [Geoglossum umbratile]|nr:MAG: hypothetical protein M1839_002987 [Geoglossum umbratile]